MKTDLPYFPHYTNTFYDRKIRRLLNNYHGNGYLVYNYLKNEIYRSEGYFLKIDEQFPKDVQGWFPFIEEKVINDVINFCAENELFDQNLLEKEQVLTSRIIQEEFIDIMKKCKRKREPLIPSINLLKNSPNLIHDDGNNPNNREETPNNAVDNSDIDEIFGKDSEGVGKNSDNTNKSNQNGIITNEQQEKIGGIIPKSENVNDELVPESKERGSKFHEQNEISLSINRERLSEIFLIEKNNNEEEINKFLNHYSKVGWCDKNGNKIKDIYAAARNWTQMPPARYHNPPVLHKKWLAVWNEFKKQTDFERSCILLPIKIKQKDNILDFECSRDIAEKCEKEHSALKKAIIVGFGTNIKLQYTFTG